MMAATHAGSRQRVSYVLSAGRAGTTSLREYLKARFAHLAVRFEPVPSRQLYVLWNVEQAGLLPAGIAVRIAQRALRARGAMARAPARVEFHSYLCPVLCASPGVLRDTHLLHIVRDPYDWITSIGNFKAASWRRHAIDRLPFTYPVHPLARARWAGLHKIERLAWMWRLINESILSVRDEGASYRLFRFEDLVAADDARRAAQMTRILGIVDPGIAAPGHALRPDARLNSSQAGAVADVQHWSGATLGAVNDVCADLMRAFGYAPRDADPAS